MKEIGGYIELEQFRGSELYGSLYKFNLGRTALVWLLQNIEHSRVFIPEYICASVPNSATASGFDVVRYKLDENLHPVWGDEGPPSSNDILYIVSYYGQLTDNDIQAYYQFSPNLIVDNAQAFYDEPVLMPGVHTIYTTRKYFGLSDGAYVSSNLPIDYSTMETDKSKDRISYLIGRLEGSAGEHYNEMLSVSKTFEVETPKRMSLFTENLLRGIDYDFVKSRRCDNYRILQELLPTDNPFVKRMPTAPFAYPYYHPDGTNLRIYLAKQKIFVPTNWSYLIEKCPEDSLEYEWSANILPLPVDQRYGEAVMQIIADAVKSFR